MSTDVLADSSTDASIPVNPLTRKLNKILATKVESDPPTLEALKVLSEFFTDNTLQRRRNLRSDIEGRSLQINEEFCKAVGVVKQELDEVAAEVTAIQRLYEEMREQLKSAQTHMSALLNQTARLKAEMQTLDMKKAMASRFVQRFQLSADEIKILRGSRNKEIDASFFEVLAHVRQIHTDCKLLLRSSQQRAGMEIMENMGMHLEGAYEQLYHWTQSKCRLLTGDFPEMPVIVQRAMKELQERPILLKYCIDELIIARRSALVRCFIDALTRGGATGTPQPIELHSHDTLRYVGDIFGWLHQAMATEKDLLLLLYDNDNAGIMSSLSAITDGVCRPLRVRVEQVIVTQLSGIVVSYRLASLLRFYSGLMPKFLNSASSMLSTCKELEQLSVKVFYASIHNYTTKLLDRIEEPPQDLNATRSLTGTLALLKEILASRDASLIPIDVQQDDLNTIVSNILEPLQNYCSESATGLDATDTATYLTNCLYLMHSTISLYEFTDQHLEGLQAQLSVHMDTLVHQQASSFLMNSGLGPIHDAIHTKSPSIKLCEMEGMDPGTVKASIVLFRKFLSDPYRYLMPHIQLLLSPRLREDVQKKAKGLVVLAYEDIYKALHDPANCYGDIESFKLQPPEQVKALLA